MNLIQALAIVKNINTVECTDEEKAYAIYLVMNMATHMSITKDNMIEVIKWLWNQNYEWFEENNEKVSES